MMPRLTQPLFAGKQAEAKQDGMLYQLVRAYDCIWTLLHRPDDISPDQRRQNAVANLNTLGTVLENALGADVFEANPNQLSFPDEILSPPQPARFIDETEPGLIRFGDNI